jgi:hypothetical protein
MDRGEPQRITGVTETRNLEHCYLYKMKTRYRQESSGKNGLKEVKNIVGDTEISTVLLIMADINPYTIMT